jgi:dihydrofolate reductase
MKSVDWKNTKLKKEIVREDILELKRQADRDILVGSPGLIVAFAQLDLVDEYQISVHPTVVGGGLPLFRNILESFVIKIFRK